MTRGVLLLCNCNLFQVSEVSFYGNPSVILHIEYKTNNKITRFTEEWMAMLV